MTSFDYVQPRSTDEAVALLARHGDDAHLIAGGTSVVLMLRQELLQPAVLVGLRGIPELRGVHVSDDGSLVIGATENLRTLERAPAIAAYSRALAEAIGHVATVRLRNQATIGGSLAHADPAQDPPSMLLALDAAVRTKDPRGEREIPLDDLFVDLFETSLARDEVITSIVLPPRPSGADAVYVKFLPGSKDDYATISVAVSGRRAGDVWSDLRIVCGAAGLTPLRVRAAEAVLNGTRLEGNDVARAAEIVAGTVDPIDDLRGSADYKRAMAQVWTRRALGQLADRPGDGAVGRQ